MSATLEGAIKALIETGGGLGASVWRRDVPPRTLLPYIVCTEVTRPPEPSGDFGSGEVSTRRLVQVDVWQSEQQEDYALLPRVMARLHGAAPNNVRGGRVYPLRVVTSNRLETDSSSGVIRDVLDVVALVGAPEEA